MSSMTTATDTSLPLLFETRRRDRDGKREAVLRTAVQLFLREGYHRATLNDVADQLAITKPAIYNYFRGKDEILFECWMMGQEAVFGCIAQIDAAGGTGLTKLQDLIRSYAALMTTDYGRCLVRFDVRDLMEREGAVVRAAKRRIDAAFRRFVADGIADGSIAPCDPKITAFAIAGSLNWIGHWFQPDGALGADEIAASYAGQLTSGLAKKASRQISNRK